MVDKSIALIIQKYLANLRRQGIPTSYGVVFGSQVRGDAGKWSDIDLLVVSPYFDQVRKREEINLLWREAAHTDSRIEPVPVGEKQWLTDDTSILIEIARREGQIITAE